MVKSVIDGVTTYYPGASYEEKGGVVTKYYQGGALRVGGTLYYSLTDQLGSTGVTVSDSGAKVAELRYNPWGEVRYTSNVTPTDRTYTGQRSYADNFGLMYYNARWYDSSIGGFAQADNIEIKVNDIQSQERFAYVLNNPILHNDPTGHAVPCSFLPAACSKKDPGVKVSGWLGWVAAIGCAFQGACIATPMQGTNDWQIKANPLVRALNSMPLTPMAVEAGIDKAAFEGAEALTNAVANEANAAQLMKPQPAAAAGLSTEGEMFTAPSSKGQIPPTYNPEVQSALDSTDPNLRPKYHGFCAEPMCISNALDAGKNPYGGTITSVKVRGIGDLQHGIALPPCPSCTELLKIFNMTWIAPGG